MNKYLANSIVKLFCSFVCVFLYLCSPLITSTALSSMKVLPILLGWRRGSVAGLPTFSCVCDPEQASTANAPCRGVSGSGTAIERSCSQEIILTMKMIMMTEMATIIMLIIFIEPTLIQTINEYLCTTIPDNSPDTDFSFSVLLSGKMLNQKCHQMLPVMHSF